LALAEKINGEIVSVDSMQVYRGLDVGTAKPSLADRARVPHHLVDVVDLTGGFDAAQFVQLATAVLGDIHGRGRPAVFCGGTGLYFKALFEGLVASPPSDPQLRAELEATPLAVLLEELAVRDPEALARIDRRNPRRVLRAIEVIRLTGRPFSTQRADWCADAAGGLTSGTGVIVFTRTRDDLRARINTRVDTMFASGLVEETRRLLPAGLEGNRTALQALGYRQVVEHLRGERGLAETVARVKQKTWQFARRQMTWFRHQFKGCWMELRPDDRPSQVAEAVAASGYRAPFPRAAT
jgi:tRNA dimethylallyltransferase